MSPFKCQNLAPQKSPNNPIQHTQRSTSLISEGFKPPIAIAIWVLNQKYGKTPQIFHLFIGFSIIFTIHFGGFPSPYFWFNIHLGENIQTSLKKWLHDPMTVPKDQLISWPRHQILVLATYNTLATSNKETRRFSWEKILSYPMLFLDLLFHNVDSFGGMSIQIRNMFHHSVGIFMVPPVAMWETRLSVNFADAKRAVSKPRKKNIPPRKLTWKPPWWFDSMFFPFQGAFFQVPAVSFQECIFIDSSL